MAGKVVKVPQVMQMEALECGAACLTMILAYYGRWVPLEKVRVDCGVSRDGSKASNIIKAARNYGLEAKGVALSIEALKTKDNLPCILFWNFCHFVVFDGFRGRYAYINDPARGYVRIPMSEFETSFTGVVLFFEKTERFEAGGTKPSAFKSTMKYLKGMRASVIFVMAAAALASFITILDASFGRVFFDRILSGRNPDWLFPLAVLMLILAIIWGVISLVQALFLFRVRGKVAVVNSSRFMKHLLHLPVGFYAQRYIGDLQMRQADNELIAASLMGQIAPVFINTLMLILYAIIMLTYSPLLTLVGVGTVVINALIARYISKKRVNIARSCAINQGKLNAATIGGIEMIDTIKSAGAEEGFFARWAGFQAAANEDNVRMATLTERLSAIPVVLTETANILVLLLGIDLIINGDFTSGALLAFTGFLTSFMQPVTQLISLGQVIQEMQTQTERIEDVMRYPTDVPEEPEENNEIRLSESSKLTGEVELIDVSFGYSPLEAPLIENFNLHLKPGQWVALVGSSGSGKSTISKLISGLYKPWSGQILFSGQKPEDIPRPVMTASLSVVDQDLICFEDSVADNIRLWDRSIEGFDIVLASRDAGLHKTITSREGGYTCRIQSGGRNFSGGELQRMEIARALALDPTIIILDEATSALDAEVEADVIKHIRDRGITCIVVAHRLSTIRDCDEIIVLDEGKIVQRGTHSELMAKGGAYSELVRSN